MQLNSINSLSRGQFNIFWISPYFPTKLPILSSFRPLVPYPLFLMIYIFGFILIAATVLGMTIIFNEIYQKAKTLSYLNKSKKALA